MNAHHEPSAVVSAIPSRGQKTRITIYLDDEVLKIFRALSETTGKGYQTLINAALRSKLAATPALDATGVCARLK